MNGYYDATRDSFITAEEAAQEQHDMDEMAKEWDRDADAMAQAADHEAEEAKLQAGYDRLARDLRTFAEESARMCFGVQSMFPGEDLDWSPEYKPFAPRVKL